MDKMKGIDKHDYLNLFLGKELSPTVKIEEDNEKFLIGEGTFSYVLKGRMELMSKIMDVAIKIPKENIITDKRKINRFMIEASNAAQLNHENILKTFQPGIYIAKTQAGKIKVPYIMMELVKDTLYSIVTTEDKKKRIKEEEKTLFVLQVARALDDALRKYNLLHGDIHPLNIFIKENQQGERTALVGDWGLARLVMTGFSEEMQASSRGGNYSIKVSSKNLEGMLEHSSYVSKHTENKLDLNVFFPPEFLDRGEYDERSEVFALGALLANLYFGRMNLGFREVKRLLDKQSLKTKKPRLMKN